MALNRGKSWEKQFFWQQISGWIFIFLQDKDPKHTARATGEGFRSNVNRGHFYKKSANLSKDKSHNISDQLLVQDEKV